MAGELAEMEGGAGGLGAGLSTYPDSTDEAQIAAHAACLVLEGSLDAWRYLDMSQATDRPRYVIWMPA